MFRSSWLLTVNLFVAAIGSETCRSARCIAEWGEDVGVNLLQQNAAKAAHARALQQEQPTNGNLLQDAHKHRREQNSTEVWQQIRGAVEIDQLQAQINEASNSETAQSLQSQLDDMKRQFPSWQEVKSDFSSQWDQLSSAVSMENLGSQMNKAKAAGDDSWKDMESQYNKMKSSIDLSSVQDQATSTWDSLVSSGKQLPGQVGEWTNSAVNSVGDATRSATESISNTAQDAASSVASGAQDAASSVASGAQDAANSATNIWNQLTSLQEQPTNGNLLQDAHKHRRELNSTEIWGQIQGAVQIDQLQEKINQASNSETAQQLQSQLDDLKRQFPSWQEVKSDFSSQWDQLSSAVTMENLETQMNKAKAAGDDAWKEMESRYNSMKSSIDLGSVQDQATSTWDGLVSSGKQLPGQVSDWTSSAMSSVGDTARSASESISNGAQDVANSVNDAWNSVWR